MSEPRTIPLRDLFRDAVLVVPGGPEHVAETAGEALARLLGGRAQIVITLDERGQAWLQSFVDGRFDANYFRMSDARLLEQALPDLLRELRSQIQPASGSAVTE